MSTPWDYITTPPSTVNYNTAEAGTTVAPGHTTPAALSTTVPQHSDPAALSAIAPTSSNPAALSTNAPQHADPANLSTTPPTTVNPAALSTTAPTHSTPSALSGTPPQIIAFDGTVQSGLPAMPASFQPAFLELTGGGNSLSTLNANAADAAAGKILQGTVGGILKSYQVRVGTDAQEVPGIIRPANHDDVTNAVIFVQL
jgi:hypothetical protein